MISLKFIGDVAKPLQTLAREELKAKILSDILIDIQICQLECWNEKEFIFDLINMLKSINIVSHSNYVKR